MAPVGRYTAPYAKPRQQRRRRRGRSEMELTIGDRVVLFLVAMAIVWLYTGWLMEDRCPDPSAHELPAGIYDDLIPEPWQILPDNGSVEAVDDPDTGLAWDSSMELTPGGWEFYDNRTAWAEDSVALVVDGEEIMRLVCPDEGTPVAIERCASCGRKFLDNGTDGVPHHECSGNWDEATP